jgi:hypothetical protein
MTLNSAASISFDTDSLGKRDSKVMRARAISSGKTWMTEACEPRAPKKSKPLIASRAFAMPIELAFNSGLPLLILLPRS